MPNKTSLIAKPAETGRITLREHAIPRDPFDENVYNILPDVIHIPDKKAMYKSIFAGDVKFQEKKGRKDAASMGPIKVHVNPPKEFLKKHTGNALVKSAEAIKSEKKSAKPPIPKAHVIIPKPTLKHFIKINALENIHSVPKKVPQAGPVFVEKKDYGKVPAYLSKRITQQHEEKIQFSAAQSERAQESIRRAQLERGIIPLPEEERLKVLEGLKLNWEKLNGDYQKLSLTVDTVPKITRKVNMEQQLKQLEEQMAKFSHENIMIDFNDGLQ